MALLVAVPVGVGGGVVVAAAVPLALHEGPRAEVAEARAGRVQLLAGALRAGVGVLNEGG